MPCGGRCAALGLPVVAPAAPCRPPRGFASPARVPPGGVSCAPWGALCACGRALARLWRFPRLAGARAGCLRSGGRRGGVFRPARGRKATASGVRSRPPGDCVKPIPCGVRPGACASWASPTPSRPPPAGRGSAALGNVFASPAALCSVGLQSMRRAFRIARRWGADRHPLPSGHALAAPLYRRVKPKHAPLRAGLTSGGVCAARRAQNTEKETKT